MNKNQVKGRANEAKGKVKAEKHGGKAEARYGDLKSAARKESK